MADANAGDDTMVPPPPPLPPPRPPIKAEQHRQPHNLGAGVVGGIVSSFTQPRHGHRWRNSIITHTTPAWVRGLLDNILENQTKEDHHDNNDKAADADEDNERERNTTAAVAATDANAPNPVDDDDDEYDTPAAASARFRNRTNKSKCHNRTHRIP